MMLVIPNAGTFSLIYKWQPGKSHPKVPSGQLRLIKALLGLQELNWPSSFLGQSISFSMEFFPSLLSSYDHFLNFSRSSSGFFLSLLYRTQAFFFFFCLAETIISCYRHVPFPLKAIKNENPHFRTVSIKQAPFLWLGEKKKKTALSFSTEFQLCVPLKDQTPGWDFPTFTGHLYLGIGQRWQKIQSYLNPTYLNEYFSLKHCQSECGLPLWLSW